MRRAQLLALWVWWRGLDTRTKELRSRDLRAVRVHGEELPCGVGFSRSRRKAGCDMRRLLCWFKHDWQCLYRSEIRVPELPYARSVLTCWMCFRCAATRQEQWDL